MEYALLAPLENAGQGDYEPYKTMLWVQGISRSISSQARRSSSVPCTMLGAKSFLMKMCSMIAASIAAFIIGASEEAVGIMLFFAVGGVFGKMPALSKYESINALANLAPPKAHKIHNGKTIDIAAQELVANDEIIVLAGEVVPSRLRAA